jgi:hypothetical protein
MPNHTYLCDMTDLPVPHTDLTPLFQAFDLTPERRGDWWLVEGLYPAIRAQMEGRLLYVEIALAETQVLTELYPAEGGLEMFRNGVFPVLLSAFWNSHNPGMVTRQIIKRPDGPWQMFTGPHLRQIETGERPPVPYLLFETVEAFLREQPLDGDLHWLSTGIAVYEDGPIADIRLDGLRQPRLEAAVCALDWIYGGRDYNLRNTSLLTRV